MAKNMYKGITATIISLAMIGIKPLTAFANDVSIKYQETSDSIVVTKDGSEYVYTIQEDSNGDLYVDLSDLLSDGYNLIYMPGDENSYIPFTIVNNSNHIYRYQEGSFTLLPYDTSNAENHLENTETFDGQQIPVDNMGDTIGRTSNKAIQDLFGVNSTAKVTAAMMNQLYDKLEEKGFTNDVVENEDGTTTIQYTALTKYYLAYYGEKYNTTYDSISSLPDKAKLEILSGNARPTGKVPQDTSDYIEDWAVVSGTSIKKILETESQIAELGWNWFYSNCLGITLDASTVETLNKSDFISKYSISEYFNKDSDAYKEAEELFGNISLDTDSNGNSVTFDNLYFYIDYYNTSNAYQGYNFGWYMGLGLYQADGDLLITKTDEDGNPLENVGYELWQIVTSTREDGSIEEIYEYFYGSKVEGENYYTGMFMTKVDGEQLGLSCTLYTDKDGTIYIRFLDEEGNYKLQETESLDGYELDETIYDIIIKGGETTKIDLVNYFTSSKEDEDIPAVEIPDDNITLIPAPDVPAEDDSFVEGSEPPVTGETIPDESIPLAPIPDSFVTDDTEVPPLSSVPQTGISSASLAAILSAIFASILFQKRPKP